MSHVCPSRPRSCPGQTVDSLVFRLILVVWTIRLPVQYAYVRDISRVAQHRTAHTSKSSHVINQYIYNIA
jgi:hypothetical protein